MQGGPWIDLYVRVMTTTERLLQSRLAFLAGKETKVVAKRLGQQKWWPSIHLLVDSQHLIHSISHAVIAGHSRVSVVTKKSEGKIKYTSFGLGSLTFPFRGL